MMRPAGAPPAAPGAVPPARRLVALLRGINAGRTKRLPMAELKALLQALGGTEVRTLLNSGNAVFTLADGTAPETVARQLQQAIQDRLGLAVPVQVRDATQLRRIAEDNALAGLAGDASRLLVVFPGSGQGRTDFGTLAALLGADERLHLGRHAVYLWCPDGILASRAASALLGPHGARATTRNWATLQKIVAAL